MDQAIVLSIISGLDWMVAGLPVAALGLLHGCMDWMLSPLGWVMLPLGSALIIAGFLQLRGAQPWVNGWTRTATACAILAIAVLLLSPFMFWWRSSPRSVYFTANLLALIGCYVGLVAFMNRLVAELGEACHDERLRGEGRSVLWMVLILWMLPLLAAFGYLLKLAVVTNEAVGWYVRNALGEVSTGSYRWIVIGAVSSPVAFTAALFIKARRVVRESACASANPAPEVTQPRDQFGKEPSETVWRE